MQLIAAELKTDKDTVEKKIIFSPPYDNSPVLIKSLGVIALGQNCRDFCEILGVSVKHVGIKCVNHAWCCYTHITSEMTLLHNHSLNQSFGALSEEPSWFGLVFLQAK